MIVRNNFRYLMQEIRKKHNILARDLAIAMSMSPSYLSAIEQGHRSIPDNFLQKLDSLLSLTIEESNALIETIAQLSKPSNKEESYEAIKKELLRDLHELFTRINANNYEIRIVKNMVTKLNGIRKQQQNTRSRGSIAA